MPVPCSHSRVQYGVLDTFASNVADIKAQKPDIGDDEYVAETTERNWQQAEGRGFIYGYNVSCGTRILGMCIGRLTRKADRKCVG